MVYGHSTVKGKVRFLVPSFELARMLCRLQEEEWSNEFICDISIEFPDEIDRSREGEEVLSLECDFTFEGYKPFLYFIKRLIKEILPFEESLNAVPFSLVYSYQELSKHFVTINEFVVETRYQPEEKEILTRIHHQSELPYTAKHVRLLNDFSSCIDTEWCLENTDECLSQIKFILDDCETWDTKTERLKTIFESILQQPEDFKQLIREQRVTGVYAGFTEYLMRGLGYEHLCEYYHLV
ncbi:TPA: hypothetical protein ACGPAJ_000962 [Streptococcus suis]